MDWNIKNEDGDTPVMHSVLLKRIDKTLLLLDIPTVDLSVRDDRGRYLEDVARENNMTDILEKLATFTGPRLRMIQRDSLLSRMDGMMTSLEILSRDAVLVSLITNNSQERNMESLVDRLGQEITWSSKQILLCSRYEY